MPTKLEWLSALLTERQIRIISSNQLISEVSSKQNDRIIKLRNNGKNIPPMKNNLAIVPRFSPERPVNISPFQLLHAIGQITTPPIQNLVEFCSTWAIVRYIWAFRIPTSSTIEDLRLSDEAREIDFHQKGLLSDQVGVGMAKFLMTNFMGVNKSVDVDYALNDRAKYANIQPTGTTIPDYLFHDDSFINLYIVECKGNQTSRKSAYNQMRRGTEQVPSITFPNSKRYTSLIIATCMLSDCTEIYILDPPEQNKNIDKIKKVKKVGQNEWKIIDPKKFEDDLNSLNRAKLLSFSGAHEEAYHQLPEDYKEKKKLSQIAFEKSIERSVNGFGIFKGVTRKIPSIDRNAIEIFQGLHEDVFNSYIKSDETEAIFHLKDLRKIFVSKEKSIQNKEIFSYDISKIQEGESIIIQSVCMDGTMLQIKIT